MIKVHNCIYIKLSNILINLFNIFRCKLYYMKDKAFVEKGLGMLHLKKVEGDDTKTQLVVRAETNLGKIYIFLIFLKVQKLLWPFSTHYFFSHPLKKAGILVETTTPKWHFEIIWHLGNYFNKILIYQSIFFLFFFINIFFLFSGNILLNILVSDKMKVTVKKNNVQFMCVPNPPIKGMEGIFWSISPLEKYFFRLFL